MADEIPPILEPGEIANFDPIHARTTAAVFPISICLLIYRSTARYAIGECLFFFLFVLLFVSSLFLSLAFLCLPRFFSFFFLASPYTSPSCVLPSAASLLEDDDARLCAKTGIAGRASYLHSAPTLSIFPLANARIPARASSRFVSEESHRVDSSRRHVVNVRE